MKNTKIIRWGIIGCGDVTEIKSGPAYQKTDGFTLAAVMRRNEELLKDYAQRHHIEKYSTNADDIINDDNIDAIYIATPPDSHKYYGLQVAQAGKICCIEKPLAPNYEDSKAINDAFIKAGVPLFVAYYRRSMPRFTKIKMLIDNGKIGVIRHINWHLSEPPSKTDLSQQYNWRTDKKVAPGGYFDDLASHGLDYFAYLFGDYQQVKGMSVNQQKLYSAFDAVSACWVHENDITGTGSWNFGSYEKQDKVTIYGSEGVIEFAFFDDSPILVSTKNKQEEICINNAENVQIDHVQNMKEQLFNGNKHPSNGTTATHTSWVMEQILKEKN